MDGDWDFDVAGAYPSNPCTLEHGGSKRASGPSAHDLEQLLRRRVQPRELMLSAGVPPGPSSKSKKQRQQRRQERLQQQQQQQLAQQGVCAAQLEDADASVQPSMEHIKHGAEAASISNVKQRKRKKADSTVQEVDAVETVEVAAQQTATPLPAGMARRQGPACTAQTGSKAIQQGSMQPQHDHPKQQGRPNDGTVPAADDRPLTKRQQRERRKEKQLQRQQLSQQQHEVQVVVSEPCGGPEHTPDRQNMRAPGASTPDNAAANELPLARSQHNLVGPSLMQQLHSGDMNCQILKAQSMSEPADPASPGLSIAADGKSHTKLHCQVQQTSSSQKEHASKTLSGRRSAVKQPSASPATQQSSAAVMKGGGSVLLDKMRARLQGGHFRFLNEALYTCSGDDALRMMQKSPELFSQYHDGFQQQTKGWPRQPLDDAVTWLAKQPASWKVADLGCGDAKLATRVKQVVQSFDLVAAAPGVVACNMADLPVESGSMDAAIFSLALMGTDYGLFVQEAVRVLRPQGWLWIAEVRSRFASADDDREDFAPFLACLQRLGLELKSQDASNKMFVVFVLQSVGAAANAVAIKSLAWPPLRACMYKRR